jgi:endonuclease/exonuclease/phosphatase (EEP) superfamily protein YafD
LDNLNGPVRVATASIAVGALAGSLFFTVLWVLRPESFWFVLITSYTPYALPGYLVALVGLLVLRGGVEAPLRPYLAAASLFAAAGLVFHAVLLAPLYLGSHVRGPVALSVVTLNCRVGDADPAAVVALVRSRSAQVAVLEEVTPSLERRLEAAGLTRVLPYSTGVPGADAAGTMVFAQYPLNEAAALPMTHHGYRVRVMAPVPFWLMAVHMAQPLNASGSDWRADWSVLDQLLPALSGPVLLVGDLNSTLEHGPIRTLLGDGFADAAQQARSGWQPTYPSNLPWIAIDHVIMRGSYGAVSTETAMVPGTDHRALVAGLALRRG